jgi:hypothetical protein
MTRKDYILIAEVLRIEYLNCDDGYRAEEAIHRIAIEMADMLHRDNSRFDREHFLAVVRGERELQSRPPRKSLEERVNGKMQQLADCLRNSR